MAVTIRDQAGLANAEYVDALLERTDMTELLIQNTPEWRKARAGSLGASQVQDALAKIKTGWGASRANVAAQLVAERLTGEPQESYTNTAMQWGIEKEPDARAAYEWETDATVTEVGLVRHPSISMTHASPDGLVGDDGLIEIKCPNTATHIETLRGHSLAGKYNTQIQWQLACTGRQWCDFVSFDPRMPEQMRLFIRRVRRDSVMIPELEQGVMDFLREVDAAVIELQRLYLKQAA